ncbi:hypothetical protein TELCIR_08694 [Teladorsagia circumcincta]|uniref:Uncharacterized protein n=1 Tax=Teladorsagia circumcincta TaxID=45464 RepID=A0A2G9UGU7_TELCI|nr:hypothetical protein TELCIR_08694 [Teladorsagia circumcincta]
MSLVSFSIEDMEYAPTPSKSSSLTSAVATGVWLHVPPICALAFHETPTTRCPSTAQPCTVPPDR